MITLNEIAYNIKNLAYGGKNSSENNISTSQIKHWVHYHRAKLIVDNINNGILNFTSLYQTVLENTGRKLVRGPAFGISPESVDFYGTNVSRKNSKQNKGDFRNSGFLYYEMPEVVMLSNDAAIKEVSVVRRIQDYQNAYSTPQAYPYSQFDLGYSPSIKVYRKSYSEAAYGNHNKFTNNEKPYYTIERNASTYSPSVSGRIRLKIHGLQESPNYYGDIQSSSQHDLQYIYRTNYSAIFQNPTELEGFDEEAQPYPIPAQYVGDLIQRVIQTEVQVELKTKADEIVDGADDNMKMMASGS